MVPSKAVPMLADLSAPQWDLQLPMGEFGVGNCDIRVKRKISVINETKSRYISHRKKITVCSLSTIKLAEQHNCHLCSLCDYYSTLASEQGILKGEVSLYHWPPVCLVWNQLYDYWQFLFLFAKQTTPDQSNRRSMVQWYIPLSYSLVRA